MPWKECHVMDEQLRFVARLLESDTMAAVARNSRSHASPGSKCRLAKARPEPDFRYFSKRIANDSLGSSIDTTIDQGRA